MKVKVISDVHLGLKDSADDFYNPNLQLVEPVDKEQRLIDLFCSSSIIVVNGDFIDGWESNVFDVMEKYERVMDAIRDNIHKICFVRGNHDNIKKFPFPQIETFHCGNYVCLHGHQFDIFNSRWWRIGKTVTRVCAFLERLGWKNVDLLFNKLKRGRYGNNHEYFKRIEEYVDKHPECVNKIILFAHTHEYLSEPIQLRNCKAMNSGTWTDKQIKHDGGYLDSIFEYRHMDILEFEAEC